MRQRLINIFVMCFMTFYVSQAQINSLQLLPEVVLSDVKLRDFKQGIHIDQLSDSLIKNDITLLTRVLQEHSFIYFRENGVGGVASPSFRGTNAQQTAVVWNGININSQLTGQTDFNTIAAYNYDAISVRSGGGSIPYGSGAVGGSVHLENTIRFGERFENQVIGGYASFDSRLVQAKTTYATDNFYLDIAGDYIASENDFEYLDTDQRNENGQFEHVNLNTNVGIVLSRKQDAPNHLLKFHHNSFLGDRNFSGTLIAPSDDAYEDRNSRSLLTWEQLGDDYDGRLSVAHVFEQFRYFPSAVNTSVVSFGKANRFVGSYDASLRLGNDKMIKGIGTVDQITGEGSSFEKVTRQLYSAVLLYSHTVNDRFNYGVQLRQEFTPDYDNPFLAGVGASYAVLQPDERAASTKNLARYTISFNASRNYRIPTFNDLYWQGAGASGNLDLIPETSLQAEIGQEVTYKSILLNAQAFFIKTENLILWQPNFQNIWMPVNLRASTHYGGEFRASYKKNLGDHSLTTQATYSYTIAQNSETNKQLVYVPRQQAGVSLGHSYDFISTRIQGNYTDSVFVTGDESQRIDGYVVLNARTDVQLLNKENHKVTLGLALKNMLNQNYQTVLSRPNPGRNFLIQTTYIF